MLACERDAVKGHGVLRLAGFVNSLKTGWADGQVEPLVVAEAPGLVCVDARNGFVQPVLDRFRDELMSRARRAGICRLQIRNSHHFAALWPDLEPFATQGLVAFACVNSKKRMAAWSGGAAVLGTNAMAFGVPREGGMPVIWDQSSSVLSQGDILHADRQGRELPVGAGVDAEGRPTTDPAAILAGGALLPAGGVKGASLAFMVEVLAAGLSGGEFGYQDRSVDRTGTTSRGGYFLLLMAPEASAPDFPQRMTGLYSALAEAGAERFPGDRRYEARKAAEAQGIVLEPQALAELLRLAGEEGAAGA